MLRIIKMLHAMAALFSERREHEKKRTCEREERLRWLVLFG